MPASFFFVSEGMEGPRRQEGGRRLAGTGPGNPLVSVVMVTFNPGPHFRQALASAEAGGDAVEILVIDGGSADGTVEWLREREERIDYWVSEPDGGIYDAMNKGLKLARGQWVGFKNADDWYCPGVFDKLAGLAAADLQTDVWYGNSYSVIRENPLHTAPFFTDHRTLGRNPGIDHRSVFIRRELHAAFPYDTRYRLAADLDVFWRLLKSGARFRHMGIFVSCKRYGGASDGSHILKESFAVTRRHTGLWNALVSVGGAAFAFARWKAGNAVLRLVLGEEGFLKFKARKIKETAG